MITLEDASIARQHSLWNSHDSMDGINEMIQIQLIINATSNDSPFAVHKI